jgi:hypothetical protein
MAVTRENRAIQITFDDAGDELVRVTFQSVLHFPPDADNPDLQLPQQGERNSWEYADLSTGDQAAITALVNVMTNLLDTDHPINQG